MKISYTQVSSIHNTSQVRNNYFFNFLRHLRPCFFRVSRFSRPLFQRHPVYPNSGSRNLYRVFACSSKGLNFRIPFSVSEQFKKSRFLHWGQETQLYLRYHTPSFSGSSKKQKFLFVNFTESQILSS